jgi:DNA-binding transcriptional LysR family regulator
VLFPSWLFSADSFRKGDLKPLLTDWMASGEPVPPGIHLLYPENRRRSRKVQLVSEYLLERIGDPPYWNGIG